MHYKWDHSTVRPSHLLFIFFCRKDDAEFFAGDIVSKIIVPHPALGFPTTLSLHYKSYSGWLSKGLPHWDIDKVVLTDSFGRSHSLCRPSTKLSSGSPVRMRLQAGNCELDNQEDYGAYTTQPPASLLPAASTDAPAGDSSVQESGLSAIVDSVESAKQRKDIFNLGTSFKLAENQTYPLDQAEELPWQPILVGNSLDKDGNEAEAAESSRSLSDALPNTSQQATNEIFEPVLKERRLKVNRGRNLQQDAAKEEIVEPVLKATTPRAKHGKDLQLPEIVEASPSANKTSPALPAAGGSSAASESPKMMAQLASGQDEPQMVQLLPFRLGELLQRAERYARETLLPLISVQAPRFFGFNVTPHDRELSGRPGESRKPRYIPRYEEAAFLNGSSRSSASSKSKQSAEQTDSAGRRNLFKLLRSDGARSRGLSAQRRQASTAQTSQADPASPQSEINYYTNVLLSSESRSMRPESPDYRPIFIDLPTFRPATTTSSKAKASRRGRVQQLP